jgi:hypothetical protein
MELKRMSAAQLQEIIGVGVAVATSGQETKAQQKHGIKHTVLEQK